LSLIDGSIGKQKSNFNEVYNHLSQQNQGISGWDPTWNTTWISPPIYVCFLLFNFSNDLNRMQIIFIRVKKLKNLMHKVLNGESKKIIFIPHQTIKII